MKRKDIIFAVIVFIIIIGFFIISKNFANKKKNDVKTNNNVSDKAKEDSNLLKGKHYVVINVKKYGKIKLELDADVAPITVTNFINLVNDKFYDGLTFHRIIDGFMIQGGGYEKDGSRKPADTIKGEFSQNKVVNNISHKRGVISMARAKSMNSASSEFFITQGDSFHLDGAYAAFGYVISGMDVVDKIAKDAKPTDNNGSISLNERPVIESINVVDK